MSSFGRNVFFSSRAADLGGVLASSVSGYIMDSGQNFLGNDCSVRVGQREYRRHGAAAGRMTR